MPPDEVTCDMGTVGALSAGERASCGDRLNEHCTCLVGGAAGINVVFPPDDAQHNAE